MDSSPSPAKGPSPTAVVLAGSGSNDSAHQRPRYDTPPQHVSELGTINNPYGVLGGHHTYVPMHASPDQRGTKPSPIANHPVEVGYPPHHLLNAYAAPRIEYLRGSAPRNPYIARADEIGVYHNIPGVGHLGLDLVPPSPWKVGDELVNPEEASYLFEKSRETARIEHERLNIESMSEEEKMKSHELWLRNLRKHELIRHHRIDIWNKFIEASSQHQRRQFQPKPGLALHPGYYAKPHQYLHPHNDLPVGTPQGQAMNSQQQSMGQSSGLPSPSGLDPYLIRQSVESAINRFQNQQTEMQLKRLQSETQLGNMLDHFKDHIGKTPLAPLQGGVTVSTRGVPSREEDTATTSYISTESQNISGRSATHSSFGSNEARVQNTIGSPLFGVPAHSQPTGRPDPLPPIREALGPSFAPTGLQMANRWTQNLQQAGTTVETAATGDPRIGGSSNVDLYQNKYPHSGMFGSLNLGTSHYAEVIPAIGVHGGKKGATNKTEKTANRAPRKKKEKKETWYSQYIQDIEHPTNIPSKEYMETTLADSQSAGDAKPRARRRRTPLKFDEKRGFPVKQSLANDMLKRGIIQASYVNGTPAFAGTGSLGELGGGGHLIVDTLTTTGETVRGLLTNNESTTRVHTATKRESQETLAGSGAITRPQGNDQKLPKTVLFSTALPKLVNPIPLKPGPSHTRSENRRLVSPERYAKESSSGMSSPPAELDVDRADNVSEDVPLARKRKQEGKDKANKRLWT